MPVPPGKYKIKNNAGNLFLTVNPQATVELPGAFQVWAVGGAGAGGAQNIVPTSIPGPPGMLEGGSHWIMHQAGDSYIIQDAQAGGMLVWDVNPAVPGTTIAVADVNGGPTQSWQFIPA